MHIFKSLVLVRPFQPCLHHSIGIRPYRRSVSFLKEMNLIIMVIVITDKCTEHLLPACIVPGFLTSFMCPTLTASFQLGTILFPFYRRRHQGSERVTPLASGGTEIQTRDCCVLLTGCGGPPTPDPESRWRGSPRCPPPPIFISSRRWQTHLHGCHRPGPHQPTHQQRAAPALGRLRVSR